MSIKMHKVTEDKIKNWEKEIEYFEKEYFGRTPNRRLNNKLLGYKSTYQRNMDYLNSDRYDNDISNI